MYLVEPPQDAQIPSGSLWGVETKRISRVIVVNSYGLRDAMQQLFVWYASIKPKMCADLLKITTTKRNFQYNNTWEKRKEGIKCCFVFKEMTTGDVLLHKKGTNYIDLFVYKNAPYVPVHIRECT